MGFNAKEITEQIIDWIKKYFGANANEETKAVVGISGGKDSSVVAALCVRALGAHRVYGVLMPNNEQADISYSYKLVNHLQIPYVDINIGPTYKALMEDLVNSVGKNILNNTVVTNNTPARLRMTILYAISGFIGGRVANTCNLSEDYVGYATKFGDGAGDFSPLSDLTVNEVKQIGYELGLPKELIEKTPIDGLCGMTDEENLGFTYAQLDNYIRNDECENNEIRARINNMHKLSRHKLDPMPKFIYLSVRGGVLVKDISEIDNLPCGNYKCPFEYTPCASACSDCSDNQCSSMGDRCYNCSNKNCIVYINGD